ncbi:MAG: alpha/beta hydrolase [Candidatus Nitrosocosmicus sp.]
MPFIFSLLVLLLCNITTSNEAFAQITYPFMASSRGSFNTSDGSFIQQINPQTALSILDKFNTCPPGHQLAIYVHGIWANENQAMEQTQRVFLSLQKSGYDIPLIGFSWDSNTPLSLSDLSISKKGWNMAKDIANYNGQILGKFIVDFKKACPNDKVRIIAHSLGARVTLSAIQWIYDNYIGGLDTNNTSKIIASVHLMGAAVNNEQISEDLNDCTSFTPSLQCSGNAIEKVVGHFYNLYDTKDKMLTDEIGLSCPFFTCISPYHVSEHHDALGSYGNESVTYPPTNYREYDVTSKIILDPDADKDKDQGLYCDVYLYYHCAITGIGDNHMGYMGFRVNNNPQVPVYNSGAIGSVVTDWRNEPTR